MCGIAGVLHLWEPAGTSLEEIEGMVGALRHRGPDEAGIYLDDWVGLGHARLSIMDLATGTEPIHNEDGSCWIVYNGEVFNHAELREGLEARGHRFYTSTDAEPVLHLYEEKGPGCLEELNGQFAFAIWNADDRTLWLARDRLGIAPLHYTVCNGDLVFASEIKAIFTLDRVPRRIDPVALDQIFTFWTTWGERTMFGDVHELPPGHHLTARRGRVAVHRYWDIPFSAPGECLDAGVEELSEQVKALLTDAVRIRLVADVPVGSYLSGGLDSSGVSSLAAQQGSASHLKTFGIQFEESPFDESAFQQQVVSFLGTSHTAVEATNKQIGACFSEVVWHSEKPLLRTAPAPLFLLSEVVRDSGLKVVLTGEGADEVFGGYDLFREAKIRAFWARQPDSEWRRRLLGRLYSYVVDDSPRAAYGMQSLFREGLAHVGSPFYSHAPRWHNTSRIKGFLSAAFRASLPGVSACDEVARDLPDDFASWDVLSRAQYLEMQMFLSHYLLSSQGDRMAMAHSVEIRVPYLDHRIVELMGRVPPRWKIRGLNGKYLLKRAFGGIVPDIILDRRKHPYRAPIAEALLHPGALERHEAVLSQRALKASGLFEPSRVHALLRKLATSRHAGEMDSMALAGILSTQLVHDQFVAHFPRKTAPRIHPDLLVDRRSAP